MPRISAEELKGRLDNGKEIVVADSRLEASYEFKYIARAISMPGRKVASLEYLDELPRDQEIVFYWT